MQFTRHLKTIKIYALTILILSLAISTSGKNLISSNKSNSQSSTNIITKSSENNQKSVPSFLQSRLEAVHNPPQSSEIKNTFDKYLAIKMLLDLGRYLIRNFQNHEKYLTYNKCIGSIKDNLPSFEPHLKIFWSEMHRISKNEEATELKNKDVVINIFRKLYEKKVKLDTLKIEKRCDSVLLLIQPKILRRDLNTVLTRDQYFGGIASMRQKPFIDSMFSVHRDHLPSNAFEILNKSSQGVESFKINSEGLTDIAVPSAADIKKARSAKKLEYAVEENYFGKLQNARFGNSTAKAHLNETANNSSGNSTMVTKNQKIHVLNDSQNIDFPGEPSANMENVEVSLDPSAAAKNIVIDRKITYPKSVENAVKNQLAQSNLLPGISGRVMNKIQNAKGQEEIFVHVRAEAEAEADSAYNNKNYIANENEMGVNEDSDH